MSSIYEKYKKEVVPLLKKKHDYKNLHRVPKIEKIVVNVGAGEAVQNPKCLDSIHAYLA